MAWRCGYPVKVAVGLFWVGSSQGGVAGAPSCRSSRFRRVYLDDFGVELGSRGARALWRWGWRAPASLLVREKAALSFPVRALPAEPLGAQWVAEAEGVLWYWHPQRGLGRLRVSRRAPKLEEGWIAPVPRLDLPARHGVALAPWGADGIYVMEPQRYWKWSQGAWQGPWEVADRVGSAVALGPDRLVANTPEHPAHPFVLLGDGGRVLARLGERRSAPHPALPAGERSSRLARSPVDGSVFAVHRFWPIVSRWKADGTFAWERKLDSPAARMLEKQQQAFL